MRFVQRCESASQLVLNLRIGSRVPVATSAMGWAYLAGLPEAAVGRGRRRTGGLGRGEAGLPRGAGRVSRRWVHHQPGRPASRLHTASVPVIGCRRPALHAELRRRRVGAVHRAVAAGDRPAVARPGRPDRGVTMTAGDGAGRADDGTFVTALARGLEILACFSASRPEIGGTQLAAMTGLPQPTVWRLCHTMVRLGYPGAGQRRQAAARDPGLKLGRAALASIPLADAARAPMQILADRFGAASGLGARDGGRMVFVQRCISEATLVMNLRVGARLPLLSSAVGWGLLAGLDPRSATPWWRSTAPPTRAGRRCGRHSRPPCAEAGADGFILNIGVFHPGYNAVAVPVRGRTARDVRAHLRRLGDDAFGRVPARGGARVARHRARAGAGSDLVGPGLRLQPVARAVLRAGGRSRGSAGASRRSPDGRARPSRTSWRGTPLPGPSESYSIVISGSRHLQFRHVHRVAPDDHLLPVRAMR